MYVYLSGKVTGIDNYYEVFADAKNKVSELLPNYGIINPIEMNKQFDDGCLSWDGFMHICYAIIDCCSMVVMLPNWKDSEGAKEERRYAKEKGKKIYYLINGRLEEEYHIEKMYTDVLEERKKVEKQYNDDIDRINNGEQSEWLNEDYTALQGELSVYDCIIRKLEKVMGL